MDTNATPLFDASDNATGCCPRFNPAGWDGQELHFENKPFLKAKTKSLFNIPLDMGPVFMRAMTTMDQAHARDDQHILVLSDEISPWAAVHYFAVTRPVPDADIDRAQSDRKRNAIVFGGVNLHPSTPASRRRIIMARRNAPAQSSIASMPRRSSRARPSFIALI